MKELEDSPYFPAWLRNFQTEFIGFVVARFGVYKTFTDFMRSLNLPEKPMFDLCSGSGEPALTIFRESGCFSQLTLSDKFPNEQAVPADRAVYCPESTDVLEMAFGPQACYTMFNAFHHFSASDKRKIVRRLQASGANGFFVELLEPTLICMLKVLFMTTVGALLLTPFIRPFSFRRLLFTYILPVNIVTITYDGIVSVCKSVSARGYRRLFKPFGDSVRVIRLKKGLTPLVVIQIAAA